MFKSVLIANRGEIAVRIAKTLRKIGIRSVVVASIPDRRSLAVRTADAWVLLEGYSAAESYLDVETVIAAAKAEGCEAIHPGYGFLSERADFAERCAAEGITFIGPPPEVLRGMGDKAAARRLAVENDVPVVPGWDGADDDETLVREAGRIGFPIMLKARGGGGGRGMREVFSAEELSEAIESARREALGAFGDGGLLLEKLVTNAHHVEVQVLADTHGNVIHLGERDCSVQRRHQKLIEETPSPVVDDALRERLTGYALKLARAIGYVNAGTFEFLVTSPPAPSPPGGEGVQDVYFLEVNPRLQVEHPVTEMVTGLDLVELQLRVADGQELPLKQEDVTFEGHAIEFRINAEDPWDGFKPSSGRIESMHWGTTDRCDFGYERSDVIPSTYDSLAGKVLSHAPTREECIEFSEHELKGTYLRPLRTNIRLLEAVRASEAFSRGETDIGWLERELPGLLAGSRTPDDAWMAAGIAASWPAAVSQVGTCSVWLTDHQETREVATRVWGKDFESSVGEASERGVFIDSWLTQNEVWEREIRFMLSGIKYGFRLHDDGVFGGTENAGRVGLSFRIVPPPPLPRRAHAAAEGATAIVAPLSGTIAAVRVAEGDAVVAGQLLLTLEAMKMEHRITSPSDGVVKSVGVRERDTVREGAVLVELG
ncbi:MAG: biotin carboxylase N-terminal domain-containing protein [Dehalococcoidia bacterium]